MGISGLLPLLKEVQVKKHVSDFKGKSLAIDGYVWLHRGAFGCAEDLVTGSKTTKFVDYAMHRVRMLRHHGVTPLMVFDGGPLPAKRGTEVDRASRRAEHLARARSLTVQGRHKEARDHYTKCVDITPEMALQLIKALKAEQVPYIVAPYEADAQLAYLEKEGIVDGIITEDSDLLVFGCRNVVYKLDGDGECIHIVRDDFRTCREFSFVGWGETEFRRMAILAGCDYLDSIPGIGIKTAHKLLRKHKTIEKVVQNVRLDGNLTVPSDYIPQFRLAELVFLHQRVYDPRTGRLDTLLPVVREGGLEAVEEGYIGPDIEPEMAKGIAEGRVHPETKEELEDLWPEYHPGTGRANQTQSVTSVSKSGKNNALGVSKRVNISGPLDAFIKRLPVKKEAPARKAFIPAPVGTRGSGPARLSDLSVSKKRAAEAAELEASLKESRLLSGLQEADEAAGSSKFFATGVKSRTNSMLLAQDTIKITYEQSSAPGDELTDYASIPPDEADKDTFPDLSSPPAACSSLQSPVRSSQHGSHFSSPGRDTEEEDENIPEPPKSSGSDNGRKRRSLVPLSPSDRLASKKRRLTVTPPRGEPILAAASSPGYQACEPPARQPSRADLRAVCGVDRSSSVHEDWETRAEADDEVLALTDEDEEPDDRAKAQAVARGLRAKYTFTPKSKTPQSARPVASRYNTTPVPSRPPLNSNNTLANQKNHSRSFDNRVAPTDSPAAKAFADATAAFGRTPRPIIRTTKQDPLSNRKSYDNQITPRADLEDSDDIIEDDSEDLDQTPTRVLASASHRSVQRRTELFGERKLSGSEKLLSFRYSG